MGKSWCMVEFDDGIQIVPQIWIEGDKCYWPTTFKNINSQKFYEKAVKDYRQPEESWALHRVRILGVYGKYKIIIVRILLPMTKYEKKSAKIFFLFPCIFKVYACYECKKSDLLN